MKVIFLDIDGVLNNDRFATAYGKLLKTNGYGGFFKGDNPKRKDVKWDFHNVYELRKIMDATKAKIVISSSWRRWHSVNTFKKMFALYGLKAGRIIDQTPEIHDAIRGIEINAWLDSNPIDNYVILDDNADFLPGQNLVQTDPDFGLSELDRDKAIKILMQR